MPVDDQLSCQGASMNDPAQSAAAAIGQGSSTPTAHASTIWPGIGKGFAHEDLAKHLFMVAAMHARRALAAAEEERDKLDRAASIGTAVELLAKAALALISPTLIADKDHKSLLLYSGVPVIPAHEAKSKTATECLLILKQSHSLDFNPQTDLNVFSVRNFALHMGQVETALFQDALRIMTRLNEAILAVMKNYDPSPRFDRTRFWGRSLLPQVDERLKEEQEARRLDLEEKKEAARQRYDQLLSQRLDDAALGSLSDRGSGLNDDLATWCDVPDYESERRLCPVCGWLGWLGYEVISRGPVRAETDDAPHHDAFYMVDVTIQAVDFACGVCGLRLHSELLRLEEMDDVREITVEASQEEIDALETYQIDGYIDDLDRDQD
jgi:hypothetical protein